ncbi:MAG: hypothetical protein WBD74_15580 [Candidatus Aquilonibacter sp.]
MFVADYDGNTITEITLPSFSLVGSVSLTTSGEPVTIATGGYVWAADYEEGNVDVFQYGAPSSGTVTYTSRRIGAVLAQHNPKKVKRFKRKP